MLVQAQPRVLSGGGNRLAPPCPPDARRKEHPGECRRNYMAPTRDRSSGFNSPPCRRPDGKRIRPCGCGAGLPTVSSPLSPGSQSYSKESGNRFPVRNSDHEKLFGCSSAVERLTVNQVSRWFDPNQPSQNGLENMAQQHLSILQSALEARRFEIAKRGKRSGLW